MAEGDQAWGVAPGRVSSGLLRPWEPFSRWPVDEASTGFEDRYEARPATAVLPRRSRKLKPSHPPVRRFLFGAGQRKGPGAKATKGAQGMSAGMKAMMTRFRATALAVAAFLFLFSGAFFTAGPAAYAAGKPSSNGVVYLLRGGLNVFSTGLDELAKELRGRGIDAKSYGFDGWPALAANAHARYVKTRLPIVIIGHSFGANAAVLMAAELEKSKTPVALLILFDTVSSMKVPANVRRVIDLVSTTGQGIGITVTGEFGFTGHIDTIDVPEGHLSMDNDPRNHDISIAAVLKVIHGRIPRGNAQ